MADSQERAGGLFRWQWSLYPGGHTTRMNLLIHIVTVPIFQAGTLIAVLSLFVAPAYSIAGLLMMVGAMVAQGRGHAGEPQAPVRFLGPIDVLSRIMAEQWIAFPRYVLSGRFSQAWRASEEPKS